MSVHDMTQQPITAQPECGASSHVSRATLWLVNNKPPWKIWPNKLFKIFEERWQTIAYDRVQELIDSRQSKKPVSFLMLSLWATRFSRWPVVVLLRIRGRDWRRPKKNKRPTTRISSWRERNNPTDRMATTEKWGKQYRLTWWWHGCEQVMGEDVCVQVECVRMRCPR